MARRLAVLQELTEAGMEIVAALRVETQARAEAQSQALAQGEAPPPGVGDLALTFSRVARAVRQTLALEARLVRDHHQDSAGEAARPAPAPSSEPVRPPPSPARQKRAYEISRVVDEAIEAEVADVDESEDLFNAMSEHLDEAADRLDFMDRPVGAIIADICRALDLSPDWSLWADRDWAMAEALDQAPGSPYAGDIAAPGFAGASRPPDVGAAPERPRPGASP